MSKVLLRLIVVIILIAGITTAVYFVLNKPDESKKVYDQQIATLQKSEYKDYQYLKQEIKGREGIYIVKDGDLKIEYTYTQAIKEQIEMLGFLCAYAKDVDTSAQKEVLSAINTYNTSAYGKDGVTYLAKYIYNYQSSESYDPASIGGLNSQLIEAFRKMQRNGSVALDKLVPFVKTSVYNNAKIDEIEFVLYDLRAMVACGQISQYDSIKDKNNVQTSKFSKCIAKLTSLIEKGKNDGFYTLNFSDLRKVMNAYNALDRVNIVGLFRTENTTKYLDEQKDETIKANLKIISQYMEV